jgi:hypothetical protein
MIHTASSRLVLLSGLQVLQELLHKETHMLPKLTGIQTKTMRLLWLALHLPRTLHRFPKELNTIHMPVPFLEVSLL